MAGETALIGKTLEINLSLLLKFQENIVIDFVEHDGLLILGKGLGVNHIVANLLHVLMHSVGGNSKKRSLIMLINATEQENNTIEEELLELSWNSSTGNLNSIPNPVDNKSIDIFSSILGDAGTVDKRRKLYANGGIISVSNRVLVTDILSHVIEPENITGLVILHAENISQYSMDRFVVNLYRRTNKWGFVKAISDNPEKCCRDFQPLATKMKYFKVDKSYLWPRFHVRVTESIQRLSKKKGASSEKITVTEVRIKMTDYMQKIQNSLMASIETLLGELRRNNPDIASDRWSMEYALDQNFVQSIVAAMNPVWHRVSITTKKLISEITTLKQFLEDLYKLDSVSFYHNIKNYIDEHKMSLNQKESLWLMIPESTATIACSTDRVFRKIGTKEGNTQKKYLLEELPKWEQLLFILDEINDEKRLKDSSDDGPIVIGCSSRRICCQLEKVMHSYRIQQLKKTRCYSFKRIMESELKYQQWKKSSGSIMRRMNEELKKVKSNSNIADEVTVSKTFTRASTRNSDRRRTRGGSVMARHNRLLNLTTEVVDEGDKDLENSDVDKLNSYGEELNDTADFKGMKLDAIEDSPVHLEVEKMSCAFIERADEIIISTFDTIDLEEIMPSYIICYEPDLTFVRNIELYQVSLKPSKCFFMYYGESVEEQMYLNSIKYEKDAFTKLIREKANMPKFFNTADDEKIRFDGNSRNLNSQTRIAGGSTVTVKSNKIIVDSREFNSQLPFVCFLADIEIIPAMLTVGDYILSDEICVERKAVRDLIESLENGRLMKQCENMFKWYKKPVLLIEFEEGKSFSFDPFTTGYLTRNSSKSVSNYELEQLQLRIAALIASFPKLSIIWSSSPFETAKIFKELKAVSKEPNLDYSLAAGTGDLISGSRFNEDALNFLRSIPGITEANSLLIINKVQSLYEFCQMSEEDIGAIIGRENAKKVFDFLDAKYN